MKEVERMTIKQDSIRGFLITHANYSEDDFRNNCSVGDALVPRDFLISKGCSMPEEIVFITDEITRTTGTEVSIETVYKMEEYDELNNKYVKQK